MVTSRGPRNKTYADYEALGDDVKAELIDGEIFMSPSPKVRHIRAATMLVGQLAPAFAVDDGPSERGPGGWWLLTEPECHLEPLRVVVRPDIAGWRRERVPSMSRDEHKILIAPDWVCEVLSPSTQNRDTIVKMPLYRSAGVQWAWILDPAARRVDVYRSEGDRWEEAESFEGNTQARIQPFADITIDLSWWW